MNIHYCHAWMEFPRYIVQYNDDEGIVFVLERRKKDVFIYDSTVAVWHIKYKFL